MYIPFQSPEIEYRRHELMGRLHKLEAGIELDKNPHNVTQSSISLNSNQHSPSSTSTEYACEGNGLNYNNNNPLMVNNNLINVESSTNTTATTNTGSYESYHKEAYFGLKNKEMVCSSGDQMDDAFLRPPLWEDITSSIQNIDPENAMMLASLPSATQVRVHVFLITYNQINATISRLLRSCLWSGETGGQ